MSRLAAALLLGVGLLQMAGEVLRVPLLKGLGAATCASPAPRVFSAVKGLETYSTAFSLEWTDREGKARSMLLTPDVYSRMKGPYNRRNVYGAVLAYGPVLATTASTKPMFDAVMSYALCGDAPLLQELGVAPSQVGAAVRVRLEPLPGSDLGDLPRVLEARCR